MTDIFREVDEDLRHERYKRLWDRFGTYVIVAAILIVVGTAGWRLWEYWREHQAQATGDRFVAALDLAAKGDQSALAALEAVAADGSGEYPLLAKFRAASEKAAAGNRDGAVADFDAIANTGNAPGIVRDLARLRAALLLVDSATVADLNTRVGDLAGIGNPWRHSAREILALASWRTGDLAGARKYYEEITADQEMPADLQSRAQFMLGLIRARLGDPEPAAAPATGSGS